MTQLLPRFQRNLARLSVLDGRPGRERATKATPPADVKAGAGQHADPIRLRGIPVVGGCAGTSPGTDPLGHLLHAESVRGRR